MSVPEDGARIEMSLPSVEIIAPYGIVSFFYRISSERGFDVLRFLVDGVEQLTNAFPQSGLQWQWQLVRFRIPKGVHSITWRYEKDVLGRSGDDHAQIAEIEVRNMKVGPVSITETLHITHVQGNLAALETMTAATTATVLGLPSSTVTARYIETETVGKLAGPSQRLLASRPTARSLTSGGVLGASMYKFYDLEIQVTCSASSICRTVSSALEHIRAAPEILAAKLRTALKTPLLRVLSVEIGHLVLGNAVPGLGMGQLHTVPAMKLYGHTAVNALATRLSDMTWLQTSCVAMVCLAVVPALFWSGRLARQPGRERQIGRLNDEVCSSLMHATHSGLFSDSE